jgi:co-chaperonin GroES (HSP10)
LFQPLHTLVTVVLDPKKAKTDGGIFMPENSNGVFLTGTVRAVGTGRIIDGKNVDVPDLHPGDRVLLAQHQERDERGRPRVVPYPTIMDEGTLCSFCDHTEILGVLSRAPKN